LARSSSRGEKQKKTISSGGHRGVAMVSAETPSESMCTQHPINEWTGGRYFLSNGTSEGFQKVAEC